jgi:RNA polymerase sigma-70 factor, ECF subfamily
VSAHDDDEDEGGAPAPTPQDSHTPETLSEAAYQQLRRKAHALVRGDAGVSPTTLVHEAFLKLAGPDGFAGTSSQHLYYALAQAMRRILVDMARTRAAVIHGGAAIAVSLDEAGTEAAPVSCDDIVAIHRALEQLAPDYPDDVAVLELLFFGGLTHEEIAAVRGVSTKTVQRRVRRAKALVRAAMGGTGGRATAR